MADSLNIKFRAFTHEDVDIIAEIAGRAFVDDPGWSALLYAEGNALSNSLQTLFSYFYHFKLSFNQTGYNIAAVHTDESGSEKVVGAACLVKHGTYFPLWQQILGGVLKFPFIFGIKPTLALQKTGGIERQIEQEVMELSPAYWRFEHVVIDTSYQRKGVGKKLIAHILDLAADSGFHFCLSTTNPVNLHFYPNLGFEVAKEAPLVGAGRMYFMKRGPMLSKLATSS
eukprot:Colp12_sorted_trinity150504_noHs@33166